MNLLNSKTTSFLILFFFMLIYANCQSTDDAPQETPMIEKEELLNNAWKSMFGSFKDEDIKNLSVEATQSGKGSPNRLMMTRPNLFRNEVPQEGILVFDGTRAAWVERSPDAFGNQRDPELIKADSWKHFEADIALIFPAFFDHPSTLGVLTKVGGRNAYILIVQLPLGSRVTYYIDAESYLIVRRQVGWNGTPGEFLDDQIINDYIDYNGILFPSGYSDPSGVLKVTYSKVNFGVDLNNELFMIPDDID